MKRGEPQFSLAELERLKEKYLSGKIWADVEAVLNIGWDILGMQDRLEEIKATDIPLYCTLYFKKFGKIPKEYESVVLPQVAKYGLMDGTNQTKFNVLAMYNMSDNKDEVKVKGVAIPKELYQGWDVLDKGNKLEVIKANDKALYCVLFFEKFGKYPPKEHASIDHNIKLAYQEALRLFHIKTLSAMDWKELMKEDKTAELNRIAPEVYREKYFKYYGVYPMV